MIDIQHNDSNEEVNDFNMEVGTSKLNENNDAINEGMFVKYRLYDSISLFDILGELGINDHDDFMDFFRKAESLSMDFQKFITLAKKLHKDKEQDDYKGIIITDEVLEKINQMVQV